MTPTATAQQQRTPAAFPPAAQAPAAGPAVPASPPVRPVTAVPIGTLAGGPQPQQVLSLEVLGVGAGKTSVYHGERSSAFLLCVDGSPVLLLDAGLGATAAALQRHPRLPRHVYISHNHTDHAGELPVLLAVEAAGARSKAAAAPDTSAPAAAPLTVIAERNVMARLKAHRLHELRSTGRPLEHFGVFTELQEGRPAAPEGLAGLQLLPARARHSEECYGLLVSWHGTPVLGWTADSGHHAPLLEVLARAPVVLVDAREGGTAEHHGFDELESAVRAGPLAGCSVHVYGYGRIDQAPDPGTHPGICSVANVLLPGDTLVLARTVTAAAAAGAEGGAAAADR